MHEYIVNLHVHTTVSDGSGSHRDVVNAAYQAGLDAVIVTDHNILAKEHEGYWGVPNDDGDDRILLLVGEEVHDTHRDPQKNHLLVLGADEELASFARNPQKLINSATQAGGLTFLAHPVDTGAPKFNEPNLSWVDWDIKGFTGIELWNGFSEYKSRLSGWLKAIFYAYNPKLIAKGPYHATLNKWDQLLSTGQRIVAIGGSDAHSYDYKLGPLRRYLFPYKFHFKAINTHIFTPEPFSGDVAADKNLILEALRQGHAFIGYDLPEPTRGFRFSAHSADGISWMGDEVFPEAGITFQIRLPQSNEAVLIKDGNIIKRIIKRDAFSYSTTEPGVYRVEAYINYWGTRRGWIFSNPIYVR